MWIQKVLIFFLSFHSLICKADTNENFSFQFQQRLMDELKLNESFFLATHHSYNSSYYFGKDNPIKSNQAEQTLSLKQQLENGIRFLMLDIFVCRDYFSRSEQDRNEKELWLAHNHCALETIKSRKGLQEIKEFMEKNPKETLIIAISDDPLDEEWKNKLNFLIQTYLSTWLWKASNLSEKGVTQFPLIKDLKGKIILSMKDNALIYKDLYFLQGASFEERLSHLKQSDFVSKQLLFPLYPMTTQSEFQLLLQENKSDFKKLLKAGYMSFVEENASPLKKMTPQNINDFMKKGVSVIALNQFKGFKDPRFQGTLWALDASYIEEAQKTPQSLPNRIYVTQTGKWKHDFKENHQKHFACVKKEDRFQWEISNKKGQNYLSRTEGNREEGQKACAKLGEQWIYDSPRRRVENEALLKIISRKNKQEEGVWLNLDPFILADDIAFYKSSF